MYKKILYVLIIASCLLLLTSYVNAQYGPTQPGATNPSQTQPVTLDDPLGFNATPNAPQVLIGKVINAVLGVVGSISLVMVIYGGFVWMTAAGNQESITKGKNILIWAVIGIIVIFMSYALVNFVFTNIGARPST